MNHPELEPVLLVVQPDPMGPLGRFADWLEGSGLVLEVIRPYAGGEVPRALAADGLIVLGGKMSSNDDAEHPWLEDIRELQRDAVRQGCPTLGICLGSQLLAQALGGRVIKGPDGIEAGLVSVTATASAPTDPMFAEVEPEFLVASMHGDVIDVLPPGAALLGSSSAYPHQAFRAGHCAWGVQFHPEIAPETYARWAELFDSSDEAEMAKVGAGYDRLSRADDAVRETSALLARRFAQLVTESARRNA